MYCCDTIITVIIMLYITSINRRRLFGNESHPSSFRSRDHSVRDGREGRKQELAAPLLDGYKCLQDEEHDTSL